MDENIKPASQAPVKPPPAKKTPDDYIFGKLLGEGSFSSVYLAKDISTQREYAIKVCEKQQILREKKADSIKREKQVMAILSSNVSKVAPFFVYLYATFQDPENLYFVMTFARYGDLLSLLTKCNKFSMEMSKFYAAEILLGLVHLHNLRIVHRDLKPENILLSKNGHILITDFGSAKILTDADEAVLAEEVETEHSESDIRDKPKKKRNSFVGTAQYVSPEVLHGKKVTRTADLWAFGCIIYQMLVGSPPFQGQSEWLIFKKIEALNYEIPPDVDDEAVSIIQNLLKLDPPARLGSSDEKRYTSIQCQGFFTGVTFEEISTLDAFSLWPSELVKASQSDNKTNFPSSWTPGFQPNLMAQRLFSGDSGIENIGNIDLNADSEVQPDAAIDVVLKINPESPTLLENGVSPMASAGYDSKCSQSKMDSYKLDTVSAKTPSNRCICC